MHIRRMELIRRATAPVRLSGPYSVDLLDVLSMALTRNKAQLFPTRRRLKLREIEKASPEAVQQWFERSRVTIADDMTDDQRRRALNLLYTWRDIFETDQLRIRRTDLIEHAIVLNSEAKPYRAKILLYTE